MRILRGIYRFPHHINGVFAADINRFVLWHGFEGVVRRSFG
jgi:hypothetical protein